MAAILEISHIALSCLIFGFQFTFNIVPTSNEATYLWKWFAQGGLMLTLFWTPTQYRNLMSAILLGKCLKSVGTVVGGNHSHFSIVVAKQLNFPQYLQQHWLWGRLRCGPGSGVVDRMCVVLHRGMAMKNVVSTHIGMHIGINPYDCPNAHLV